jgi:Ca-activated chloride channel family protein
MVRASFATLLCFSTAVLAVAQDSFLFKVDTQLVTVDFYVDDAKGKAVTHLRREDFVVLEDGQPREIQYFESAENPYNILLLFDRSSSTEDQWPFLVRAIDRFVGRMPDRHQVALAAFDDRPEMLLNWRTAREFSRRAPQIVTNNAGTDVYRALEWAVQQAGGVKGRRGVIVLTDGIDNDLSKKLVSFDREGNPRIAGPDSDDDFQKMLKAVIQARVPIYFVGVNTDRNPDPREEFNNFRQLLRVASRERMELVADRSNGAIRFPKQIEDIGDLYERIGEQLGNAYSLGFAPTHKDGAFHRIDIQVRDKAIRVTPSRDGYFAR